MFLGSYYALADMGFNTANVKYLAEYWGAKKKDQFIRFLSTSTMVYLVVGSFIGILGLIVSLLIDRVFEIPEEIVATSKNAAFIYSGVVAIRLLVQPFRAALMAMEHFRPLTLISISSRFVTSLAWLGALVLGGSLATMAAIALAVEFVGSLVQYALVRRRVDGFSIRLSHFNWESVRTQFSFGGWVILRRTASRTINRGGVLMLGFLAGPAMVPFYSLADSLVGRFREFVGGINQAIMPKASELTAANDHTRLRHLLLRGNRTVFSFAVVTGGGLAILTPGFLNLWLGPEYIHPTSTVAAILALVFAMNSMTSVMKPVMTGQGKVRVLAMLEILGAVLFLILAIPSIRWWGPVGVAVPLLISRFFTEFIVVQNWARRECEMSFSQYTNAVIRPGLLACILPVAATLGMVNVIDSHQASGFLVSATVYGILGSAGLLFMGIDDATRSTLFNLIARRQLAHKS